MGIACKQQVVHNIVLLLQPCQLTAIAPAEPIPPHYILLALCLLARPFQSVFRVQCLCVSPPSDLRLQRTWTWTPRRVRAAHPSACLVSLSLTLSLPPASPLLLCSTQRGTVCCTVSLVPLLLSSCPRLAPHSYPYIHTPREVATAHSKQSAHRQTHDSTHRQKEHCHALLIQACLAQRPTFFVQVV